MKNFKLEIKSLLIGAVIGLAVGVSGTTATMSAAYAATNPAVSQQDLQVAIDSLTDDDMGVLIRYMSTEGIDETNQLLGGDANVKAFVSTYCTVDPDFGSVVIDYAQ